MTGVLKRNERFPDHLCVFNQSYDRVFPASPHPPPIDHLSKFLKRQIIPWNKHFAFRKLRPSTFTREYDQSRHANAKNWTVIHPHSKFCLGWQLLMILVITASLFVTPFAISFILVHIFSGIPCPMTHPKRILLMAAFLIDMVFAANILVKFCTGFCDFQNGSVVMGRRLIVQRYLRTWFTLDILTCTSSIQFVLFTPQNAIRSLTTSKETFHLILHAVSMTIIYRVFEVVDYLHIWISQLFGINSISRITRFAFVFIIFCHYMACLHFWLPVTIRGSGTLRIVENSRSWLADFNTTLCGELGTNYLQSIDRTVSFFTGFNFKFPQTNEDHFLFLTNSWFGKALLVYAFAMALEICQTTARCTVMLERTLRELKDYMRNRRMPTGLTERLLEYYNYRLRAKFFDEKKIYNSLPNELQSEVRFHCCRNIMENIPMFQKVPRKVFGELTISS